MACSGGNWYALCKKKPQDRHQRRQAAKENKMILADKITNLRKKAGWSQEELAEKLGVSRQAVSKWESAQSVPDLNKVLLLAKTFGVTTDYLLRDECEEPEEEAQPEALDDLGEKLLPVSLEEANAFLTLERALAPKTAFGVFLCIEFSNPEPSSVGVGLTAECGAIMESHMVVLHGNVYFSVFDASFNIFHGEGFSSVSKDHAIETGSGSVFSVWMDVDVSGEGVPVGPCRSFLCAEICPFSSCIQVECPFSSNGG